MKLGKWAGPDTQSLAGQIKSFNIGPYSIRKLLKGFSRKLITFTFLKGFVGCCVEEGFDGHCGGSKETSYNEL